MKWLWLLYVVSLAIAAYWYPLAGTLLGISVFLQWLLGPSIKWRCDE